MTERRNDRNDTTSALFKNLVIDKGWGVPPLSERGLGTKKSVVRRGLLDKFDTNSLATPKCGAKNAVQRRLGQIFFKKMEEATMGFRGYKVGSHVP
jgi:hypothetical protein